MLTSHVHLRRSLLLVLLAMPTNAALTLTAAAQATPASSAVVIEQSGAVHVPAHVVPMSEMLSPEGKAYPHGTPSQYAAAGDACAGR